MATTFINRLFNGTAVRIVPGPTDEPWFIAADACAVLGIHDVGDALALLDKADVSSTDARFASGDRVTATAIVNKSGVYALLLQSSQLNRR